MVEWVDAGLASQLDDQQVVGAVLKGLPLALYKVDGQFFATAARCTHAAASLVGGFLDGFLIECPIHAARFDIRTGEAQGAPAKGNLRVYPVKAEGGRLLVEI